MKIINGLIFSASILAGIYLATLEKNISFLGIVVLGVIFGVLLYLLVVFLFAAIVETIRRKRNGIDLFATLETDPEKVKQNMLFIMQFGHAEGIVGAFKEFNKIFRNYPQWQLQDWEVFRAWYKHEIDHMAAMPDIYGMRMKDGSIYTKESDPLYDPKAPDWSLFDRKHYDDEDNEDDENDYSDNADVLKKSAEDGFYTGIGLGATDNTLNK